MADVGGWNGVVLGLERLVEDEGIHHDHLPGCCCRAAVPAGALVEPPEIDLIEAGFGPDRGRDALSRAWNHDFGGIPMVRFTTECPRPGPGANLRRLGGIHHVQGGD